MAQRGLAGVKAADSIAKAERDIIANPELALHSKHQLRNPLHGILRVKIGRLRVFYIVSRELGVARVVYIGFRKAGDKREAYSELTRLIRGGKLDADFEALSLEPPKV